VLFVTGVVKASVRVSGRCLFDINHRVHRDLTQRFTEEQTLPTLSLRASRDV
jgi:hypothetical protein